MNPIQSEKLITLPVKNMLLDLGKDDIPRYARKTVSPVLKLDACEGFYIGRNEAEWLLAHCADRRLRVAVK